jgi:hypothetical protein
MFGQFKHPVIKDLGASRDARISSFLKKVSSDAWRAASMTWYRLGPPMRGVVVITALAAVLSYGGSLSSANTGGHHRRQAQANGALLSDREIANVGKAFRSLIDAENAKDPALVDRMIWNSPSTLLVDKLEKVKQGEWPGAWGYAAVRARLHGVIAEPFVIQPDYPKLKVTGLTGHSAEVYAPVEITAGAPGQSKTYPVLMIVDWVKTLQGWRMATNVAIPMPRSATP